MPDGDEVQKAADAAKAKADAEAKETQGLLENLKAKGLKIYSDDEMKEAIKRRDEALRRLDKFEADEKKAKEGKLLEEKKYEELARSKSSELEREQLEKKALAEELKVFKEREAKELEELLAVIKDENHKVIAQALPSIDFVRKYVESLEPKGGPSTTRGARVASSESDPYKMIPKETYSEYQRRIQKIKMGERLAEKK